MTREDAIKEIISWTPILLSSAELSENAGEAQEMAIKALSTPKKGEWIPLYPNDPDLVSYECKSCGEEQPFKWNFCPNCGADMRSGEGCQMRL